MNSLLSLNFTNNCPMAAIGPMLPTWATQQVGRYLEHSGRAANVVATAALNPDSDFASTGANAEVREPNAKSSQQASVAHGLAGGLSRA
jgi:hypothetical protein